MVNKLTQTSQKNKRRSLLIKAGIKQVEIANALGVSSVFVYRVLAGEKKSERVQNYIAKQLRMSVTELWQDDAA